jgi:type II secretory pathway component GspD/PulD (secretin)
VSKKSNVLPHALIFAALGGLGVTCTAQQPAAPPSSAQGQANPTQPPAASGATSAPPTAPIRPIHQPTGSERRRASKLYLEAARLYEQGNFEEALSKDEQALALDPANENYRMAVEVARAHAVTALIQAAAKARMQGDALGARTALSHAYQLDPHNPQLAPHLPELGDASVADDYSKQRERATQGIGELERLLPSGGRRSFHFRTNQRTIIQSVFSAFSVQTTIDESIRNQTVRFDIDDATFEDATHALAMVTHSFFEPIDPHHAVVALDTREYRAQFTRNGLETVYLAGMNQAEMTDMGNLARNVFEISQTAIDQTSGTLTLRAPQSQLDAFNTTFNSLLDGRSQVLLDVKLIQLAHSTTRNTGVTPPQQVTAFNVYAEEQSILNQNQALVQQIISSGLAAPGDTLAILAILLASGQVSSSLLQNGVLLFGGGLTLSGVVTKPFTVNLSLNSSDSRELDQFQLRLGDGEEGALKSGTRYPIQTSSYTNLGVGLPNIPGLNLPGTSTGLSGLLGNLGGATPSIPMVQYEDLGLTLKATPSIMRSGDIALKIDMKISTLAGSALNGVPILANRAWTGVVTVPQNQAVVVATEMDKNESRAISGVPGLSEIPGFNNITGKVTDKNYSSLLIVMTPHLVRSPRLSDHTNMVRIERNVQTR